MCTLSAARSAKVVAEALNEDSNLSCTCPDACKLYLELAEVASAAESPCPTLTGLSLESDKAAALLQVFSTSHKLSDINDSYWDFRVEAVPDEELNASAASRTIHVYHIAPQSTAVRCCLAPYLSVWPFRCRAVSRMRWLHTALCLLCPQRLKAQQCVAGYSFVISWHTTGAMCTAPLP